MIGHFENIGRRDGFIELYGGLNNRMPVDSDNYAKYCLMSGTPVPTENNTDTLAYYDAQGAVNFIKWNPRLYFAALSEVVARTYKANTGKDMPASAYRDFNEMLGYVLPECMYDFPSKDFRKNFNLGYFGYPWATMAAPPEILDCYVTPDLKGIRLEMNGWVTPANLPYTLMKVGYRLITPSMNPERWYTTDRLYHRRDPSDPDPDSPGGQIQPPPGDPIENDYTFEEMYHGDLAMKYPYENPPGMNPARIVADSAMYGQTLTTKRAGTGGVQGQNGDVTHVVATPLGGSYRIGPYTVHSASTWECSGSSSTHKGPWNISRDRFPSKTMMSWSTGGYAPCFGLVGDNVNVWYNYTSKTVTHYVDIYPTAADGSRTQLNLADVLAYHLQVVMHKNPLIPHRGASTWDMQPFNTYMLGAGGRHLPSSGWNRTLGDTVLLLAGKYRSTDFWPSFLTSRFHPFPLWNMLYDDEHRWVTDPSDGNGYLEVKIGYEAYATRPSPHLTGDSGTSPYLPGSNDSHDTANYVQIAADKSEYIDTNSDGKSWTSTVDHVNGYAPPTEMFFQTVEWRFDVAGAGLTEGADSLFDNQLFLMPRVSDERRYQAVSGKFWENSGWVDDGFYGDKRRRRWYGDLQMTFRWEIWVPQTLASTVSLGYPTKVRDNASFVEAWIYCIGANKVGNIPRYAFPTANVRTITIPATALHKGEVWARLPFTAEEFAAIKASNGLLLWRMEPQTSVISTAGYKKSYIRALTTLEGVFRLRPEIVGQKFINLGNISPYYPYRMPNVESNAGIKSYSYKHKVGIRYDFGQSLKGGFSGNIAIRYEVFPVGTTNPEFTTNAIWAYTDFSASEYAQEYYSRMTVGKSMDRDDPENYFNTVRDGAIQMAKDSTTFVWGVTFENQKYPPVRYNIMDDYMCIPITMTKMQRLKGVLLVEIGLTALPGSNKFMVTEQDYMDTFPRTSSGNAVTTVIGGTPRRFTANIDYTFENRRFLDYVSITQSQYDVMAYGETFSASQSMKDLGVDRITGKVNAPTSGSRDTGYGVTDNDVLPSAITHFAYGFESTTRPDGVSSYSPRGLVKLNADKSIAEEINLMNPVNKNINTSLFVTADSYYNLFELSYSLSLGYTPSVAESIYVYLDIFESGNSTPIYVSGAYIQVRANTNYGSYTESLSYGNLGISVYGKTLTFSIRSQTSSYRQTVSISASVKERRLNVENIIGCSVSEYVPTQSGGGGGGGGVIDPEMPVVF